MQIVIMPRTEVGEKTARRLARCLPHSAVFCTDALPALYTGCAVVVFDGSYCSVSTLPAGSVGIFLRPDTEAAAQASSLGLPVFSCGFSPRDALTLSSDTGECVVFSLQRSLRSIDGTVIEPFEKPISGMLDVRREELLAAAAVLLALGMPQALEAL